MTPRDLKKPGRRRKIATRSLQAAELPNGWLEVAVREAGAVQLGAQKSSPRNKGYPKTKYLRSANVTGDGLDLTEVFEMEFRPAERVLYSLEAGDVLVVEGSGSSSQVGRSALWSNELPLCCFQNSILRFRRHLALPQYARAVFRHYQNSGKFGEVARGVGIQHLGTARFSEMSFPLPPFSEQARIVSELERRSTHLKEARASLESAFANVKDQRRSILAAAAFGELVTHANTRQAEADGGPTTPPVPRTRRRQPVQLTIDLDDQLNAEFENHRGLRRELPLGWKWIRVGAAGELRLGRQVAPQHREGPNPRKYLRVGNVFDGRIDTTDVKSMNFSPSEFAEYRLQPGDVLINEGQSFDLVGRTAMFTGELRAVAFQNHLIRFRAHPGVLPEFALLVFRHYFHSGQFRTIARGSTNLSNLGIRRVEGMPFPLPPEVEQKAIVKEARRRLDSVERHEETVASAIKQIDIVERELYSAAVSGRLVPQSADDEPASVLKERLGLPPLRSLASVSVKATGRTSMKKQKGDNRRSAVRTVPSLTQVLVDAGRPVSLTELFSKAGYDRDSTEQVESFYHVLRKEIGKTIRIVESGENALVEPIHAP